MSTGLDLESLPNHLTLLLENTDAQERDACPSYTGVPVPASTVLAHVTCARSFPTKFLQGPRKPRRYLVRSRIRKLAGIRRWCSTYRTRCFPQNRHYTSVVRRGDTCTQCTGKHITSFKATFKAFLPKEELSHRNSPKVPMRRRRRFQYPKKNCRTTSAFNYEAQYCSFSKLETKFQRNRE